MEDASLNEEGGENNAKEVAPALIDFHPSGRSVAVAIGPELRLYDIMKDCAVSIEDKSGGPQHSDSVRAMRFCSHGDLFASAGDDKLVKIYSTKPWQCIKTVSSEKRVTAVAISHSGLYVCYADKFGVVWVVGVNGSNEPEEKASPLFAHYCSIITSLEFSPDGRFIVSADRDFKIRVNVFPKKPFSGAHEIQSFCLGHTEFVSCLCFVHTEEDPTGFLLSGSGDATVRLWDSTSGSLLDTSEVGVEAGVLESNGKEEMSCPAITDIRALPSGSLVAVAVQSLHGIVLLKCHIQTKRKTLSIIKVVSLHQTFIPTSIALDSHSVWMVMGASNLPGPDCPSLTRLRVIDGHGHEHVLIEDGEIRGGKKLLETLQGSVSTPKGEEALALAAEAVKTAMRNLMIKREYSVEKRELRKKRRNDIKLKEQDG